jgi:putative ABC transport system ATP-binding protein
MPSDAAGAQRSGAERASALWSGAERSGADAAGAGVAARCERLIKIYFSATGETQALRGVEASFQPGAVTAVTGPSGSGKSSLLGVLALRDRPSSGELWLFGTDVATLSGRARRQLLRTRIGWVAQRPTHCLYPHLTAAEQILQVARLRGGTATAGGAGSPQRALLDRLGLAARARARPAQLSGGEQQRLAVASAVVGTPGLVVADEPTAELDDDAAAWVLAELRRCAKAGSAVVYATHDPRGVAAADRVLHLRHGVLSTDHSASTGLTAPIDSTGRLQLPPEALPLFPDMRAVVVVDEGQVRLIPPTTVDNHD